MKIARNQYNIWLTRMKEITLYKLLVSEAVSFQPDVHHGQKLKFLKMGKMKSLCISTNQDLGAVHHLCELIAWFVYLYKHAVLIYRYLSNILPVFF